LFDPDFPLRPASWDIVFCRNLLIYFDRPTQARAVGLLAGLLAKDGVLFVGPSETALLIEQGFESARIPLAFAFRNPPTAAPFAQAPAPARPPAALRSPIRRAFGAALEALM